MPGTGLGHPHIDARSLAMAKERPSTLLGPVQEGERVEFLAYVGHEASALRAALPVLWPFLATAIRRDPRIHEKSLDELVASVLAERDTWHRRVEQARLLARQRPGNERYPRIPAPCVLPGASLRGRGKGGGPRSVQSRTTAATDRDRW